MGYEFGKEQRVRVLGIQVSRVPASTITSRSRSSLIREEDTPRLTIQPSRAVRQGQVGR